jgi:hypothetical protein
MPIDVRVDDLTSPENHTLIAEHLGRWGDIRGPISSRRENTVGRTHVQVHMAVEQRTEAVQEGDHATAMPLDDDPECIS